MGSEWKSCCRSGSSTRTSCCTWEKSWPSHGRRGRPTSLTAAATLSWSVFCLLYSFLSITVNCLYKKGLDRVKINRVKEFGKNHSYVACFLILHFSTQIFETSIIVVVTFTLTFIALFFKLKCKAHIDNCQFCPLRVKNDIWYLRFQFILVALSWRVKCFLWYIFNRRKACSKCWIVKVESWRRSRVRVQRCSGCWTWPIRTWINRASSSPRTLCR